MTKEFSNDDIELHHDASSNQYHIVIKNADKVLISGKVEQQYDYDSGDYLPLGDPIEYEVTVGSGNAPMVEFYRNGLNYGCFYPEYAYGHFRAIVHGANKEELCEVVFDLDRVNLNRHRTDDPIFYSNIWLINELQEQD